MFEFNGSIETRSKPFVISNIYPTIEEKSKGFSSFFMVGGACPKSNGLK